MRKRTHEIRDPIHTFVRLDSAEREIVDSSPLQRLRHIHQLATTYLVYPGATHRRFEHSLGVMELAGRVFDVITRQENLYDESVRGIVPSGVEFEYWKRVLRVAALCHDVGHLPFSHAAEKELLPNGWDHERLTVEIIRSEHMRRLWESVTPPLRWLDIAKLAVGPKKCATYAEAGVLPAEDARFDEWQSILAEVIVGDAFGVDRMDYLLRDSYHAGVVYGRFDHYRLVDTLRILPKEHEESKEPALGVEEGGLRSAEALLLARYFMYSQVYFHPVRRIYDVHLKDFLTEWLRDATPDGRFPTSVEEHLALTDNEIMGAVLRVVRERSGRAYESARRLVERDHYHLVYQWNPTDAALNPEAVDAVFRAACEQFESDHFRRDKYRPTSAGLDFPVLTKDDRVESSFKMSSVLQRIPAATFDFVFASGAVRNAVEKWLKAERAKIIEPRPAEEINATLAT